jgi:hypothetical protein
MLIDTQKEELRRMMPPGLRFKFGPDRFQLHALIACTPTAIIYRDPQGRLQEVRHREIYAIMPKWGESSDDGFDIPRTGLSGLAALAKLEHWDQNQNGTIDDADELASFAEHADHGQRDYDPGYDPVCYCGELESQHGGMYQDHGFVAAPENENEDQSTVLWDRDNDARLTGLKRLAEFYQGPMTTAEMIKQVADFGCTACGKNELCADCLNHQNEIQKQ